MRPGNSKNFPVCLPVKAKPSVGLLKYDRMGFFSSLLHSPRVYRFNLDFYNRALQLNSLATETQTSEGVFMVLVAPL